jgi:hypothetical protein
MTTVAALLARLRPNTDLSRLVVRVSEGGLPCVVISRETLDAWARRDPEGWKEVSAWLGERGVTLVRIPAAREVAATA